MDTLQEYTDLKPYDPSLSPEEKKTACMSSHKWTFEKLMPFLIEQLTPTINEVIGILDKVIDWDLFTGLYDQNRTYNFKESVTIANALYVSLEDNNNTDPRTTPEKWFKAFDADEYLKVSGGTMTGTLVVPKIRKTVSNGNGFQLNENQLFLWAKYAANDESLMLLNMYDDGSNFEIKPKKSGVYQTQIRYNFDEDKWYLGNSLLQDAERIEDYHELTLINQWTGSLKFTKFANGWVQVIGAPKNSGGHSSYWHIQIATLPQGYRPATTQYMASPSSRWGYTCWCDIKPTGEIACDVVGDYKQFINFVYRAEN